MSLIQNFYLCSCQMYTLSFSLSLFFNFKLVCTYSYTFSSNCTISRYLYVIQIINVAVRENAIETTNIFKPIFEPVNIDTRFLLLKLLFVDFILCAFYFNFRASHVKLTLLWAGIVFVQLSTDYTTHCIVLVTQCTCICNSLSTYGLRKKSLPLAAFWAVHHFLLVIVPFAFSWTALWLQKLNNKLFLKHYIMTIYILVIESL